MMAYFKPFPLASPPKPRQAALHPTSQSVSSAQTAEIPTQQLSRNSEREILCVRVVDWSLATVLLILGASGGYVLPYLSYFACLLLGVPKAIKDIAALGVSEGTIKLMYRLYYTGRRKLVKNEWIKEGKVNMWITFPLRRPSSIVTVLRVVTRIECRFIVAHACSRWDHIFIFHPIFSTYTTHISI